MLCTSWCWHLSAPLQAVNEDDAGRSVAHEPPSLGDHRAAPPPDRRDRIPPGPRAGFLAPLQLR